ncbi:thioesterase family protein [Paenibacillus qinlingensis]|uniref:Acyl-CoA thioester hydrolase n=1 Tax=Paenibacillus qinlingensis TaxID=1837343 RepID=A0ABU1NZJ7_9BACL|nr:thioesterase family protein [Paenibacillus qinlingensis]MDR6552927.1 acyl-CoA thioester hydrolase [Paenibacillus qinlingensis]
MNQERWHGHQLRVRYQETDQMGVVYHANYLTWFEIGRTELIRSLGYPYSRIEEKGLLLPVTEADLKFKKPARYDDLVGIYTQVIQTSSIRLQFAYEIRRIHDDLTEELLVTGTTSHVWVNPSWRPVRIEKEAPELWQLITKNSEGV